jgi:hypothetical protein
LPDDSLFYFEPGSEAALVEALRFMWNNPAEVLRRLAVARALLPRLSWQAERTKFLSFYSGVMHDVRPAAPVLSER